MCRAENPSMSSLRPFSDESDLVVSAVVVHSEDTVRGWLGLWIERLGVYAQQPQQFYFLETLQLAFVLHFSF